MLQKPYRWAAIFGAALFLFTLYLALDTFVIARVYQQAAPMEVLPARRGEALVGENFYRDEDISVTLTEHRVGNTTVYVADVSVSSPQRLRTALARGAYGRNVDRFTSLIAQENDAVLAVNGDYYGARPEGYVIRNGVLYREKGGKGREDLVVDGAGDFSIVREDEVEAQALLDRGAEQVLSFGPALVEEGQVSVEEGDEVDTSRTASPRTAIAQVGPLHYLFVVSDGRTQQSEGLTLYELAQFLEDLGAQTAYNLDGGGSSSLYFMGRVVNQPTTSGVNIKERGVSDIVFIG